MKKSFLFILLTLSLLLQGCFEVIEQVQLNNDGSGNFQLTLNLSKSKTKITSILKLETINGHPVPTKASINEEIKEIEKTIAKTPGITNVKTSMDWENYIAVISYHFSNLTQLNKSIKNIKLKEKAKADLLSDDFAYDATTKTFTRKNNYPMKEVYAKMSNADREIFANANYTSIYKFESEVTAVSNKDAKIAASKKAVMLKQKALDIITEKKSIENKINITQ